MAMAPPLGLLWPERTNKPVDHPNLITKATYTCPPNRWTKASNLSLDVLVLKSSNLVKACSICNKTFVILVGRKLYSGVNFLFSKMNKELPSRHSFLDPFQMNPFGLGLYSKRKLFFY